MKKLINKNNKKLFLTLFIALFLCHFPLMIKNIITADVLLNNYYYEGYAWELSLGRFGVFLVGLLKAYFSFPHIDLIISYFILSLSFILLLDLFEIKDKILVIFSLILLVVSPVVSATILFHYCSIAYFISFFLSICSIYLYYKWDNKYGKIIAPIICIIGSLSFYQAYLSFIVSLFIFYNIRLILQKKIDYKNSFKYVGIVLGSIIGYFIIVKLSQAVLHIDMANYSDANNVGLSTILSFPRKIIDSYILFYQFFFTNKIMKNTYFHNNIFNLLLLFCFSCNYLFVVYKSKVEKREKIILVILLLLIPVFVNSVIFVISEAKLQLLMSASYLLIYLLFISLLEKKYIKILTLLVLAILYRNYFIQDQATYASLENTFNRYKTVIMGAYSKNINHSDYKYLIIGEFDDSLYSSSMYLANYGYIADSGIFWDEYNLRKLGFERYANEYLGIHLEYASEEEYNDIIENNPSLGFVSIYDDVVVINLGSYK